MPDSARPHTETTPPPAQHDRLTPFIRRNIEMLRRRHAREQAAIGTEEKIAETITQFSGSMTFVYIHAALVALWTAWNVGLLPHLKPFDPSFVILATVASVEAIFLSTFVLISQNRGTAESNRRDELELHMTLLAEHEITRMLKLVRAIADKLDVHEDDPELEELQKSVAPDEILDHIEVDDSSSDDSKA